MGNSETKRSEECQKIWDSLATRTEWNEFWEKYYALTNDCTVGPKFLTEFCISKPSADFNLYILWKSFRLYESSIYRRERNDADLTNVTT